MIFLLSCLVPLQDPKESTDHDYEIVEYLNAILKKASEEVTFSFEQNEVSL